MGHLARLDGAAAGAGRPMGSRRECARPSRNVCVIGLGLVTFFFSLFRVLASATRRAKERGREGSRENAREVFQLPGNQNKEPKRLEDCNPKSNRYR